MGRNDLIPAWMLWDLERLRREQEVPRPHVRPRIEIPIEPPRTQDEEPDDDTGFQERL